MVRLAWRYVVQETVGPLKGLAKRAVVALAGIVVLAVGLVVLLIAVLRVLEGETGSALTGTWNFAPYLLTAVVAIVIIGVAVAVGVRAGKGRKQ